MGKAEELGSDSRPGVAVRALGPKKSRRHGALLRSVGKCRQGRVMVGQDMSSVNGDVAGKAAVAYEHPTGPRLDGIQAIRANEWPGESVLCLATERR
jgi:hypothetical protein